MLVDVDEAFVEKLAFIYDTYRFGFFGFMVFSSLLHRFSSVSASFERQFQSPTT
jgi:hypothetical protein